MKRGNFNTQITAHKWIA